MANKSLTEKQVEFCRLYVLGKLATEAYSIAFKNNNSSNCKVNASKLLKRDDIQLQVKKFQDLNKSITDAANQIAAKNIAEGSIADRTERMQVLTQIMRGEIKLMKPMVVDKVIEEIEVVPDWMDRKNAIAELNKMDGEYAAVKQETKIEGTVIQIGYGSKRKD